MDFKEQTSIFKSIFLTFFFMTECVNSARLDLLRVIDSNCQLSNKLGGGCRRDRRRNLPQVLYYKIRRNATSVVLRVIDSDLQQSHKYRRGCRRDRRRSLSYIIEYRRIKIQRQKNVNTFFSLVSKIHMQKNFDSIPLENPWKIINTSYGWKQRYRSRFAQEFIENLWAQLILVHGDGLTSLDDPHSLRLVGAASEESDEVVLDMNGYRGRALLRQDAGEVVTVHQGASDELLPLQVECDPLELKYFIKLGKMKVTSTYLAVLFRLKFIPEDFMFMTDVLNTRAWVCQLVEEALVVVRGKSAIVENTYKEYRQNRISIPDKYRRTDVGTHSTAGNNIFRTDLDLEHFPGEICNEGEGTFSCPLVTSRELFPTDHQTASGPFSIDLVGLLPDLLDIFLDLLHFSLKPTLTFFKLLDPSNHSRVGNRRHGVGVRPQRREVIDNECEESETKRYFFCLGFIYLSNRLFIQSTHQVQEVAEAEEAEFGSGEKYNHDIMSITVDI